MGNPSMAGSAIEEVGLDVSQLREALAVSEMQLKGARAELGRLVRITERDLAVQRGELEAALSLTDILGERLGRQKESVSAFIKLIRDSELLPQEVIISWLIRSELFDPDFYLESNNDVAAAQADPGEHFLRHGLDEKRAFSETFSECA
jgi:hypothetical protein